MLKHTPPRIGLVERTLYIPEYETPYIENLQVNHPTLNYFSQLNWLEIVKENFKVSWFSEKSAPSLPIVPCRSRRPLCACRGTLLEGSSGQNLSAEWTGCSRSSCMSQTFTAFSRVRVITVPSPVPLPPSIKYTGAINFTFDSCSL